MSKPYIYVMENRLLGGSALSVSAIGFGCMSLDPSDPALAATLINQALDAGINYFDTADLYNKGANEELIGAVLKPFRQQVVIATKVGNEWRSDGSGWDWNPRKDYILKAVDNSLRRLQTDYIDLYQLHGGTIDDPIDEVIEAFERLVEQGKIRYYGLSSIRPNVIRAFADRSRIVSVMLQYSLLDRRPEEELLFYLRERNIGVLSRGGLAQGLLIDKPARDYLGYREEEVRQLQKALQEQTEGHVLPLAIYYVLENAAITGMVTGFRTVQQLTDVLEAYRLGPGAVRWEEVRKLAEPQTYPSHR